MSLSLQANASLPITYNMEGSSSRSPLREPLIPLIQQQDSGFLKRIVIMVDVNTKFVTSFTGRKIMSLFNFYLFFGIDYGRLSDLFSIEMSFSSILSQSACLLQIF